MASLFPKVIKISLQTSRIDLKKRNYFDFRSFFGDFCLNRAVFKDFGMNFHCFICLVLFLPVHTALDSLKIWLNMLSCQG